MVQRKKQLSAKDKLVGLVVVIVLILPLIHWVDSRGHSTKKLNTASNANTQATQSKPVNWASVMKFSGQNTSSSDITSKAASDYFDLQNGHIKIDYTVSGNENYPVLSGYVRGENQNVAIDNPYYFYSKGHKGEESAKLKPGKYNLLIDSTEIFTVEVFEQR